MHEGEEVNCMADQLKRTTDIYFQRYPKIKEYLENIVKDAEDTGYVLTILKF